MPGGNISYHLARPIDALRRNDNGAFATRQMLTDELARGNDRLAGFGKQIMRVAEAGDEVAQNILRNAGQQLGIAAAAVIRKLHMENEEFRVAYVGGVYGAEDLVLLPMQAEIKRVAKKAYLAEPLYSPPIAAGRMARSLLRGDLALAV